MGILLAAVVMTVSKSGLRGIVGKGSKAIDPTLVRACVLKAAAFGGAL